jgi:DNA-binding winged helix-turn-helix (wHTH) protein
VEHGYLLWIDTNTGRIWCNNREPVLRPKELALLKHLVLHAGQVVTIEELQAAVWPGIAVSIGAVKNTIYEIRGALKAQGSPAHAIELSRAEGTASLER